MSLKAVALAATATAGVFVPTVFMRQCAPEAPASVSIQTFVCGYPGGIMTDVCWVYDCDHDDYNNVVDRRCYSYVPYTGVGYAYKPPDDRIWACYQIVDAKYPGQYDIAFKINICGAQNG